jgi:hypothetical protein
VPAAPASILAQVWERLASLQRQQRCQVLSLLIARRLLPATRKEVTQASPGREAGQATGAGRGGARRGSGNE